MDVESLAKQLILQNMTPEQQTAVLDSIRASVLQAKDVQKQRIGENVQVVVQALKKLEADIRARYDKTGKAIEKRVASIKDGQDGRNGTDGKAGKDGRPGRDGAAGPKGADGQNGNDGRDGTDGVSVTDAHIDFDGSLVISLSSGRTINVGEVVAPDLAEKIKVITNGGGTSQTVIDTLASLQTQIDNLIPSQTGNAGKFLTTDGSVLSWSSVAGGLSYQGTWNASTNTPTLASGVGVNGYYYITATAGSTNLDGITDWQIGDWLMFNGTVWQKIDQSNLVTSVNGQTGAVSLSTTDISEGTNLYYTDARARAAVSAGTGISYSSATGVITNAAPDQTVALTQGGTTTITGTYPNFTISSDDQYDGTVTSVSGTGTVNGISLSGTVTSSGSLTLGGTLSNVSLTTQVTGTLPIANGGTGVTASTGTIAVVLSNSPTLVTPILGTPQSVTLTNGTGLPISTGVSGLGLNVAAFLATPSSANLAAALTNETGTGSVVFATSPTLVTPALGTPSALVGTNITGTAAGLSIGGTATTATTANALNTANSYTVTSLTATSATGKVILATDGGGNVSLGRTDGVASTPFLDFNSGATAVDYDVRVQASGGNGTSGNGTLTVTGTLAATTIQSTNGLVVNSNTVTASYSIPSGSNAMSAGPMTVNSGITVTVPTGSRWVVL